MALLYEGNSPQRRMMQQIEVGGRVGWRTFPGTAGGASPRASPALALPTTWCRSSEAVSHAAGIPGCLRPAFRSHLNF